MKMVLGASMLDMESLNDKLRQNFAQVKKLIMRRRKKDANDETGKHWKRGRQKEKMYYCLNLKYTRYLRRCIRLCNVGKTMHKKKSGKR